MNRCICLFFSVFLLLTAQAQETFRYKDTLSLDLYLTEAEPRALVLYVHGGGFSGGSRDGGNIPRFCERLTREEIAVASISYHLTMRGQSFGCDQAAKHKLETFRQAAEDIHDAADYLRKRSELKDIPIVLAGSSAGAEAVLHAGYWHFSSESRDPYAGVISMAGAITDIRWITSASAIPTMLFHGTCDPLVPYDLAPHHYCQPGDPGYLMLAGGYAIAKRLKDLDLPYYLVTSCGGAHEWAGKPMSDFVTEMVNFINIDVLGNAFRQIHHVLAGNKACEHGSLPHICETASQ